MSSSTKETSFGNVMDPSFAVPVRQATAIIAAQYGFEPGVGYDKGNVWFEVDKLDDKGEIPHIIEDLTSIFGDGFEVSLMMQADFEAIIVSKIEHRI